MVDHGRRQERVPLQGTLRLLVKGRGGLLVGSGEILDLSVPAVKSVLFRARTELREKLKQYLDA